MEQRIDWVDTLKGIGIFLIVWGHYLENGWLRDYIFSFHVPLFFFVSGYLFNHKKHSHFSVFFKKRFKSIIVPYLFFSFISLGYVILKGSIGEIQGFSFPLYKPILGIFYSIGANPWLIHNIALWFLTCLFIVEITYFYINKMTSKKTTLILLLLTFSIVGYIISIIPLIRLPWSIDIAFTAIVFYGVGHLYRGHVDIKRKYLFVPLFILSFLFSNLNRGVDMNYLAYGNYFYFYISAFSGIFLFIIISQLINKNFIFAFLGINSLIILGLHLHWLIERSSADIIISLTNVSTTIIATSIFWSFIMTSIAIILIFPLIFIINKYIPFIIGKSYVRINQTNFKKME